MRTVTYRADESLKKVVIPIGFVGENEHTRVIFDCAHIFREYPSATASISVRPPVGNAYPSIVVHDGDYVYWDVTNADLTHRGLGEIQLTFTQGTKICKTYTAGTLVEKSIMGTGPVPVPLSDFIARASAAVTAIPDTINAALAAAKASGEFDGEDGFSPVMSVQSILGGHRLTVTDAEGSFYVDIMDGTKGLDGFAPTVTITDIDTGHRVTITDKYGAHTFDVLDGEGLTSFNYNNLYNKPTIGGVAVNGDKSPSDYGAAELDENGKVKSSQLPSYVDDVEEYASLSEFPATGESGKIYIALDTNLTYRWGGSTYVLISSALALGETSDTAYRGDRGKSAYDHASDASRLTTAQVSGLYKIAVTSEGHVASVTAVTGSDLEELMPVATIAAEDYSDLTFPVAAGKLCTHENKLYKANQAISTSESWTAAHWDSTTVEAELALREAFVVTITETTSQGVTTYSADKTYAQIKAAVDNKQNVVARYVGEYYPLRDFNYQQGSTMSSYAIFMDSRGYEVSYYTIHSDDSIVFEHYGLDLSYVAMPYEYLNFPIAAGTYCVYAETFFKAKQTISTAEDFNENHWDGTNVGEELFDLKTEISSMQPAATSSDIGKALLVKTVADGKPTSWEYGEAGGLEVVSLI